ncbi:MAG: TOBE domain-containing protein [Pirellulaceae bacterium]
MLTRERTTLWGEVLSVTHSANSCRITVELKGTPDMTAMIMKESTVEIGLAEGATVYADVDASNILIGVCPDGVPALSECGVLPTSS